MKTQQIFGFAFYEVLALHPLLCLAVLETTPSPQRSPRLVALVSFEASLLVLEA